MELKQFPDFNEITLEQKECIESAYKIFVPAISDLVFSNLYAWQEYFDYKISLYKSFVLIYYEENNKIILLPPLIRGQSVNDDIFKKDFAELTQCLVNYSLKVKKEFIFRYFPEVYINKINAKNFRIIAEREYFDYIYKKGNLSNLEGQKLSPKRNLVKQFKRRYVYRYEQLNKDNAGLFLSLVSKEQNKSEYVVVRRFVESFEALGLIGGLLFVDNVFVAGTFGKIINKFDYGNEELKTLIVHFEKASTDYKGAYQMINQLFCQSLSEDVLMVNREEDLGISGLKKSKMSYAPYKMIKKYKLILG